MALNLSPVLCVHQSCSVKGNDLDHLVEDNQAVLFCSIVFEHITRPYPLPPPQTNIFYIPNIKTQTRRFFQVFPRWASAKHVTPGRVNFVSRGQNF